jgi:hypothetical protein
MLAIQSTGMRVSLDNIPAGITRTGCINTAHIHTVVPLVLLRLIYKQAVRHR